MILKGDKEYFKDIPAIKYEGPKSDNPLAFKYYNPDQIVAGKTMREHFKFAVAYWHTFCGQGADPFGIGTQNFLWDQADDPIQRALDKADAAFEFITCSFNFTGNIQHDAQELYHNNFKYSLHFNV